MRTGGSLVPAALAVKYRAKGSRTYVPPHGDPLSAGGGRPELAWERDWIRGEVVAYGGNVAIDPSRMTY
jgi:hypothetical protein